MSDISGDPMDVDTFNASGKAQDEGVPPVTDAADGNPVVEPGSSNQESTPNVSKSNMRKNIKKIMSEEDVGEDTLKAQQEEVERLRRVEERAALLKQNFNPVKDEVILSSDDEEPTRQPFLSDDADIIEIDSQDEDEDGSDADNRLLRSTKTYEARHRKREEEFIDGNNCGAHADDRFNVPDEQGRVLVNVGHPKDEQPIYLSPQLARAVKPHQIGGIRFMYDNIIDNMKQFSRSEGFGCILAHSMGLGKTIQVVSFIDVYLTHTKSKHVLCIVPINTLQNWMSEFDMWLPSSKTAAFRQDSSEIKFRNFNVYMLNDCKTLNSRAKEILAWRRTGGVLLLGYEMYKILTTNPKNFKAKPSNSKANDQGLSPETYDYLKEELKKALVDPGPDLVICDEGHRIKNCNAATSQALKKIRTKRRIVLTGYPLQNNLIEYWCMVDFVRPNFLGNKQEFSNMFERPISNGQCADSTPEDRKLMKQRAHVLHKLLRGFVQRRSHSILTKSLPRKHEHVVLVRMTPIQKTLMVAFLERLRSDIDNAHRLNPIMLFSVFVKVWNHPDILYKIVKEGQTIDDLDIDLMGNSKSTAEKKGSRKNILNSNSTLPSNTSRSNISESSPSTPTYLSDSLQSSFSDNISKPNQSPGLRAHPNYSLQPYSNGSCLNAMSQGSLTIQNYGLTNNYSNSNNLNVYEISRQSGCGNYPSSNSDSSMYISSDYSDNSPNYPINDSCGGSSIGTDNFPDLEIFLQPSKSYNESRDSFASPSKFTNNPSNNNHQSQTCNDLDSFQSSHSVNPQGTSSSSPHPDYFNSCSSSSLYTTCPPPTVSSSASNSTRVMDYQWAEPLVEDYKPGLLDNGLKMLIFFEILEHTILSGDKILVFSHSLFTLDIIEQFLSQRCVPQTGKKRSNGHQKWTKGVNYYRIDGSTTSVDREKLINTFNSNREVHLFLLSTRAGCLGINLIGANRIIVFDASWNPCHDAQAACRVYRYGQQKECYIYRLICDDSLERRIYDRQVTKQEISHRVVDELNPETNFTRREIDSLIDDLDKVDISQVKDYTEEECNQYEDDIIRHLCRNMSYCLSKPPFEHESLLLDRKETKLSQLEKKIAEENYIALKQRLQYGQPPPGTRYNPLAYSSASREPLRLPTLNPTPIFGQSNSYIMNSLSSNVDPQSYGASLTPPRLPNILTNYSTSISQNSSMSPTAFAENLRQSGYNVKKIVNPTDFQVLSGLWSKNSVTIPKNTELLLMQSPHDDWFIRTPEGNMYSIKLDVKNNLFSNIAQTSVAPSRSLSDKEQPQVIELGSPPINHHAPISTIQPRRNTDSPEIIFLDDDDD